LRVVRAKAKKELLFEKKWFSHRVGNRSNSTANSHLAPRRNGDVERLS
jgi:hypothetical protein